LIKKADRPLLRKLFLLERGLAEFYFSLEEWNESFIYFSRSFSS
jgi:hypothetical protein